MPPNYRTVLLDPAPAARYSPSIGPRKGNPPMPIFANPLPVVLYDLALVVCAVLIALVIHQVGKTTLARLFRAATHPFMQSFLRYCGPPVRWLLIFLAVRIALELGAFTAPVYDFITHLLSIILIIAVAWFVLAILNVAREWLLRRYEISRPNNLHARRVHTQIKLLEQVVIILILIVAFGCVLMTFDRVRELGVSLLASAGIVGVILGFAAQKILSGLLAGLQVAITEPIRIDDVVIVDGEWGSIEEITLTYVVVRIWDLRRLVVPMTYFLEKPFQNWTRTSTDLIGTVFLYVDPTVDVEPIRAELRRLAEASPLWDKKVAVLQVTDVKERTVELRCLVSAANSSDSWNLRCLVREQLLAFIKQTQPTALPRIRYEGDSAPRPMGLQ